MTNDANPVTPARSCGTCTLCCKVLEIAELGKPKGAWCKNCRPGSGCIIYPDRPQECRTFHCGYLTNPDLGEEWRPSHSKIVVMREREGHRIIAHVDPQRPDAWKRQPYHMELRRWASISTDQVVVCIGRRTYMIFPDRDVDLGILGDDDRIVSVEQLTPLGVRLEAYKVHKDDPRVRGLAEQTAARGRPIG